MQREERHAETREQEPIPRGDQVSTSKRSNTCILVVEEVDARADVLDQPVEAVHDAGAGVRAAGHDAPVPLGDAGQVEHLGG